MQSFFTTALKLSLTLLNDIYKNTFEYVWNSLNQKFRIHSSQEKKKKGDSQNKISK